MKSGFNRSVPARSPYKLYTKYILNKHKHIHKPFTMYWFNNKTETSRV